MNTKGELRYIIFLSVFFGLMTVGSAIFLVPLIQQTATGDSNWLETWLPEWIPFVGPFLNMTTAIVSLAFVHPYVAIVLGSIITVPLGYLILRLVRGGG